MSKDFYDLYCRKLREKQKVFLSYLICASEF